MAGFCKLVAQNWHKNSALVRACSDFIWRASDCEELSGGYSQEMSGVGIGRGVIVLSVSHSHTCI